MMRREWQTFLCWRVELDRRGFGEAVERERASGERGRFCRKLERER